MQFPVPQFTDVEDKIIAGLTFKQFGIIFLAAVFTFVIYVLTKNIPSTIVAGVLTGVPALALTFGKLNGRPLYASAGSFIKYLFGAKVYVYHKSNQPDAYIVKEQKSTDVIPVKNIKESSAKLKELTYVLEQNIAEEAKLSGMINNPKK